MAEVGNLGQSDIKCCPLQNRHGDDGPVGVCAGLPGASNSDSPASMLQLEGKGEACANVFPVWPCCAQLLLSPECCA